MKQTSQTQAPGETRECLNGMVPHGSPPRDSLKPKIYTLQDGLQASLRGCRWAEKKTTRCTRVGEYLYFGFELNGEVGGSAWEGGFCSYTPNWESVTRRPKRELVRHLVVGMNRDFIDNRLGGTDHPGFPKDLLAALEQGATGWFRRLFTVTPWIRSLVHQAEHSPYQGRLAELYLEARVLDLLVLTMEAAGGADTAKGAIRLTPQDVERVHQAGHILVQRMEDPPTLIALSREVGFSETKLKKGFRTVFNSSVFGYLRKHRLLRARDLLSGGDMTVFQAASAVGYANASHFAKAFFNAFGVLPGTYLGEARDRATAAHEFPSGT